MIKQFKSKDKPSTSALKRTISSASFKKKNRQEVRVRNDQPGKGTSEHS